MSDNRRKQDRLPAEVKVDYRTVGSFITDYSTNISQGGVFIATSVPLPVGEEIRLRITLPGRELPFALKGVVRWVSTLDNKDHRPPGMGVQFADFDEELRGALAEFVDELGQEEPGE